MKKHLNLLFPQWQGGGQDLSTYVGAQQLKSTYFPGEALSEVEVSTAELSEVKKEIRGYEEIHGQLKSAKSLLEAKNPDTIFTVGGGCDADMPSIAFLNEKHAGDMTVLYIDAHGDLNTPQESPSKLFFGMPLRTLLGEGEKELTDLVTRKLSPGQIILAGTRDLDKAEASCIEKNSIRVFSVKEIECNPDAVLETIGAGKLYIHIDLDVLEPEEYPDTPVPTAAGLHPEALGTLLRKASEQCDLVGLGLLEYQPLVQWEHPLIRQIMHLGIHSM